MKKLLALLLVLLLTGGTACAATVTFTEAGPGIILPDNFTADTLTEADIAAGLKAVYISPEMELDVYVYPANGETPATLAEAYGKEDNTSDWGTLTIKDVDIGFCLYSVTDPQGTWYAVTYLLDGGSGEIIEMCFWMNDASLRTKAAEIIHSVIGPGSLLADSVHGAEPQPTTVPAAPAAIVDGPVQLGHFTLSLPAGTEQLEVPANYAADGMIAWYTGRQMDLQAYLYPSSGLSLEEMLAQDVAYYSASDSGIQPVCGIDAAWFISSAADDTRTWTVYTWLLPDDGQILELDFYVDGITAAAAVAAVMETLSK